MLKKIAIFTLLMYAVEREAAGTESDQLNVFASTDATKLSIRWLSTEM